MAYLTRSELHKVKIYTAKSARISNYHVKSAAVQEHIFLSHSHKDSDIVNQVVELLGNQGVKVYVDWKDDSMPAVTSPETAVRIKLKINGCNKFVLLATNNALDSLGSLGTWRCRRLKHNGPCCDFSGDGSISILERKRVCRDLQHHRKSRWRRAGCI